MDCTNCQQTMLIGTSKCEVNAYNIYDNNDTFDFQWKTHDIASDDEEIGTEVACYYCKTCDIVEHLSSS